MEHTKIKINKYWFKKRGKKGVTPTTWEGWALFSVFIGSITQVYRIVDGIIPIFIVSFIIAAVYFKLTKLKTHPTEVFDKGKDKLRFKQLWGALAGMALFFVVVISVTIVWVKYEHASAGSVTNLTNGWMEFQAKNDSFSVEVPVYPKYSVTNQLIPNTSVPLKVASYESKVSDVEDYSIAITDFPPSGDYSNTSLVFSNSITGMKNNLSTQTGEEPTVISSPMGTFLSYPSETFSIQGTKNDYKIEGIVFIANQKLYLLFYTNDKEHFSEDNYSQFTDSMKLE